jgi:hypothetical protein
MVPVAAPRFDLAECNTDAEATFVSALHARAEAGGWYADSWLWDDRVIISVDVSDPERNCVLRTLRVDFRDGAVAFGPDETHQFAADLDPARPGVFVMAGLPAAELAGAAADWLERETGRPIARREWDGPRFSRTEWVLTDTGQGLVFSDSANARHRADLGPPSRVVPVVCRSAGVEPALHLTPAASRLL